MTIRRGPEQVDIVGFDGAVPASVQSTPGFAEAYKQGVGSSVIREAKRKKLAVALKTKPKTSVGGRTQKDTVRTDRHPPIQVVPRFAAGRRLAPEGGETNWRVYLSDLRDLNPELEVVSSRDMILKAVTDAELARMLDERFKEGRVRTSSKERSQLRRFVQDVNAACAAELEADYNAQSSLLGEHLDIAEGLTAIANEPDDRALLASMHNLDGRLVDDFIGAGTWVPASFNVVNDVPLPKEYGQKAGDILEVTVEDSQGILNSGRDKFLEVLGSFGLNTNGVERRDTWSMEITTPGTFALEGLSLAFPRDMPMQVPLAAWKICEIGE